MGHSSSTAAKVRDCEFVAATDFHDNYVLGKKLGKGAFAQVYLVSRANDEGVSSRLEKAVKIIDIRDKGEKDEVRKLQKTAYQEASIWDTIGQHPHCVRMYDAYYDADFCYMVMEKCNCGLYQYLEKTPEINERFIGELITQMFFGISHVHKVRVVHRDIKPDNFLVGGEDGTTVKLGDFGLSHALPADGRVTGVFGTAPFMCPEMIVGRGYDETADIWSMGVLAYALLFGNFPYVPKVASSKAMKQAIIDGKPPSYDPPGDFSGQMRSEVAVDFIKTLMDRNPDTRPSAVEAMNLSYMVACRGKHHMEGVSLPSLRPMIHAAKRAGAFDLRDLNKESSADTLLRNMQMEKHGGPLAPAVRTTRPSSKSHRKQLPPLSASSRSSVSSSRSNAWDNASTVKSGMWDNASSVKSMAWANSSSRSTTASSNCSVPSSPAHLNANWTPLPLNSPPRDRS